ncbi:hypothetical protein [Amycolatopsis sp. NPDC059021]|uniref:hypothetical protein n=1 Tax=Amycolatopsis sp. NPDC059021 TaxID=3346704 RepID=UPI00366BBADF
MDDEAEPMSAEESLNLIARQKEQLRRELRFEPARLLLVWGVAWLVGWGLLYLAITRAFVPVWLGIVVVAALFVAAIGYSAFYGIRRSRGIRGPSRLSGALYGWSWGIGYLGLWVVNVQIGRLGLPDGAISLLWSGSSLLLTGVLYLAGGAIWQDKLQFGLGGWMILSAAASVLAGYPGNFGVLCLCGGGGFLLAALVYVVLERRGHTVRGRNP